MTITIPTGDLCGIVGDVLPFAFPKPDLPGINCVRLEWDGQMMHALSTDRYRIAISSWHPDDQPDQDVQEDLFSTPGGADEPWATILPLADAKDLVDNYKLPPKESFTALTVDHDRSSDRLKVARSRDTGYSALTQVIDGQLVDFPDVRKFLADTAPTGKVEQVVFTAKLLADFAKVRQRDAMALDFTGPDSLVHVSIGKRFAGAIMPVKLGADRDGAA